MKSTNRNLKIAAVSVITIIFSFWIWVLITSICGKLGIKLFENIFIYAAGLEICELICQYFVIKKYNNGRFSFHFIDMKLKQNSFKQLLIGVGIGIIVCITYILILSVMKIIKFKGIGFMFHPANNVIMDIISIFVVSILAGFVEEITYRGIILNQLMQFKGTIFAIIISSLIFAMFHGEYYRRPYMLFSVFLNGIVFGYLYIITGSLYLSIGLHFATDFFTNISSNCLLYFDAKANLLNMFAFVEILVALILILGLVLYRYKNKKIAANIKA